MSEPSTRAPRVLPIQGIANRIVRGMLATPLIGRAAGGRLVTVYVIGRKSGRRYVVPVAYTRDGDSLLSGSPFAWGKNLRTGEPVTIRLKGRRRQADVEVFSKEDDVVRLYARMCRDNRVFARFNNVSIDASGAADADDLHAVWAAGARVFRFTPR